MSETTDTSQTKKRQKMKKLKPIIAATSKTKLGKKKKHKSRLKQEYQDVEREVQELLESSNLAGAEKDTCTLADTEHLDFFQETAFDESTMKIREREMRKRAGFTETETEEDTENSSETNATKTVDSPAKTSTGQSLTTATILTIEADVADAVTHFVERVEHKFDDNLLYVPSGETLHVGLKSSIEQTESCKLKPEVIRMLNRFHEEAKAEDAKVNKDIVAALTKNTDKNPYMPDDTLYRTYCEHKFNPIFCAPSPDAVDLPTRKLLKIYLKKLYFTEHPQLTEEHRLANLLEELYTQYTQRLVTHSCQKLEARLQTERKIVNNLLKREAQDFETLSHSAEAAEKRGKKLEQHLLLVRTLRTQLYEEEITQRKLLRNILDNWLKLKNLRKSQEYQCTRFKLSIQISEPTAESIEQDAKRLTERFETDLHEMYQEALEHYYCLKRLWKQRDKRDAKKRPKKPNIANLSNELRELIAAALNQPNEPKVSVVRCVVSDEEFYKMTCESRSTKFRSFFMKLYFDRQLVSETRTYRMEEDFSFEMNETIGIVIERRLPKDIRIALYEKSKLVVPKKVANIIVPLPIYSSDENTNAYPMQNINFSSHKQPISGCLCLRFQCDEEIYPTEVLKKLFPAPKEHTKIPEELLKTWYEQRLLQQPAKELVIEPVTATDDEEHTTGNDSNADTCTFEEDLLQFCAPAELQDNKRFQLLRSRYLKNDARTRDLRLIPALEKELEYDWTVFEEPVIEAGNWMDAIDVLKHEGKKYMKNLYEAIRNQCERLSRNSANAESLVLNDEPFSWGSVYALLKYILAPLRYLNPFYTETPVPQLETYTLEDAPYIKIILNVVGATGVPIRMRHVLDVDSKPRSGGSSKMFIMQNTKYSNVRPFVVLSYRDKLCRTQAVEGANPIWNEELILQLSGDLTDLRDDIKISIFDEIIESHASDDLGVPNMDIYQRVQTNWLGEYRIPINTLLQRRQFDGIFELCSPKILLGYRRPTLKDITTSTDTNIVIDRYPEIKEAVRIGFSMRLEPNIELPRINTTCLECVELREVREHLQNWSLQCAAMKPQRFIKPLVCTAEGKRVCMTRLLEPVPLPIESGEQMLESIIRYVTQLSLLKQCDPCMGFDGVWLNNQILLDTTWGTAKDLGLLLCNFMLTLGIKCWLALGLSVPHGESAFVLYQHTDGDFTLIDPGTGRRYAVKDAYCPMDTIKFVIAQDNLYCNIQFETNIALMNFNFRDSFCWLPVFSRRNPAPLGGIQKLDYTYRSSLNIADLRKNIERKVMKKISSWRAMRKTIWNRAFQSRLQLTLAELEQIATFSDADIEDTRLSDQLVAEFPAYRIYGFTLNFPYTNMTSISERIRSTGIHLNSDKNVEFSVAVHIHAYNNNVLSVWLFLMSITPA